MMFSFEFDERIVMKKSAVLSGMAPPDDTAKIPDGAVALIQSEELKFHRVINNES